MNWYLILASCSPRRRELIKYLGMDFECLSVDAEESFKEIIPEKIACEISEKKARACYEIKGIEEGQIIIGSDTSVVLGDRIFGKPKDRDDAFQMISELSGKSHYVYTGVTLIYRKNGEVLTKSFAEATEVIFDEISGSEINSYLDVGEYKDKAGSYAIQGVFGKHIKGINGDYNNVVGFPVARIFKEIKKL